MSRPRCARRGSPSTRTRWPTRMWRRTAATWTRSSGRPKPARKSSGPCARSAPSASPILRRSTEISRYERLLLARREYRVDADKLIQALTRHADDQVRGELLRVYWYDAARDRVPTIDQRVIAQMPWVKLRLGNLNARGQQKGVDAQIRADMEALARHRAITDAILVAGDEDMVPAVEAAQAFGVRVHLWGVEPPYGTNQAERLVWESDTVDVLERTFMEPFFTRQLAPEPAAAADTGAGRVGQSAQSA